MTAEFAHHRERYIRTGDPSALRDMLAHVTPANETRARDLDRPTPTATGSEIDAETFDDFIREGVKMFLVWPWAPLPADFDGSRFAWVLRTIPQALIVFAIIYACLTVAGVVHG